MRAHNPLNPLIMSIRDVKSETVETKLVQFVVDECATVNVDDQYDEMLDSCYSFKGVGGPFEWMSPSRVLKETDPTAYRCGKNDWLDGEEYFEIGNEYYQKDAVEKAQAQFVEDLKSSATDLESEIEDLESDDNASPIEIGKKNQELHALREDIKTAENYSF